ncbi:MAG: hypothetical protein CVT49_03415 [candidate division Zixibacteria bacterium HGW-Zixibacteria-1]|nr:MAG: hypothetical protein CVT49_03415 [candidate division Zixibacteria bacterium HGW-Zixibacteria-1]
MLRTCLVLLLFSAVIIAGCSGDNGTNPAKTVIMPLKIGNIWTGKLWTLDEGTNTYYERQGIYRVSGENSYDNQTWFVLDRIIDNDTAKSIFTFRNETAGLYALYETDSMTALKTMWAKYPVAAGYQFLSGSDNSETVTVTAIDTVVSVPYGEFICNVYKREYLSTSGPRQDIYYLGTNIGFIKIEFFQTNIDDLLYMNQMWELEIYQGSKTP